MYKKTLLIVVSLTLVLAGIPVASVSAQEVPRPREISIGTIGEPETVDPQWLYDTASAEICMNVYDTLINFKVDRTETYRRDWGKTDEFVPSLATDWYLDESDPEHPVYHFEINTSIVFQNGHVLTTEDVEYTFERWFVLDHDGGPQWMIYEPLTYPEYGWPDANEDGIPDPEFASIVDEAIESNDTHVQFKFAGPYPTMIFLQVIAQSWAGILPKDWAIAQGCWDGNWDHVKYYHDPLVSPLMDPEPVMCGTGPYAFVEWISGSHWRLERFVDHWQGWPAPGCDDEIDVVTEWFISEWPTRKLMFLGGDLDFCYVPRMYMGDVLDQPGIRCDKDLPELVTAANFFNFNISLDSRYLYPPFITHLDYGVIDPSGIPPDFFSDKFLRKAFCFCVNYTEFLEIAFLGEASYPATPAIRGLPFRRSDAWYEENQYYLNLTEAEYYFKLAWGGSPENPGHDPDLVTLPGEVWTKGFTLPITFNVGNVPRETMAKDELELHVESLNPKFKIDVYEVEWGTVYIPELFDYELTLFVIGWLADYPDPHNFFFPFMHSEGAYAKYQSYYDPHVDELIEEGGTCVNETRREEIYYELQEIYIEDAPSVCTYQPLGRHWERDWVQGWYYNPIYPGGYFVHYWKAPPTGVTIKEIDLSVIGSITNVEDISRVYVLAGKMYPYVPFELTVHREDTNTEVHGFLARAGINRTDVETGHWVLFESVEPVYVGEHDAPPVTAYIDWQEDCPPGDYNISGVVRPSSGYAVDPVPENNIVYETVTGIVEVLPTLADLNGDDVLDREDVKLFLRMWLYIKFKPTGP